jgi:ABC-type multidrug transport system fused ATPase/permease subunit
MSAEFWAVVGIGVTLLLAFGASQRETYRRFDVINERLDTLNERLSRLEARFDEMSRWSKDLLEALVRRSAA